MGRGKMKKPRIRWREEGKRKEEDKIRKSENKEAHDKR